jgi:SAM-dependent methyltransferase
MSDAIDRLTGLYRTADQVRASGMTADVARMYYEPYVRFASAFAPAGRMLDVGCGAGWSTWLFVERGYEATGIDLNPAAFEPPPRDGLRLTVGSGTEIPFPDSSFDAVGTHQCLEHIPDPARMLSEMVRVVRPGGVVCVVGPNLLGLGCYVPILTRYVWRNRPLRTILFRPPEMPRHPFGNTLPEALAGLVRDVGRVARKSLSRRAEFTMREPDLKPPFHSDNDAVYVCNPLDLTRHFRQLGCEILRDVALGRGGWTRMMAGGTWVAARKPG